MVHKITPQDLQNERIELDHPAHIKNFEDIAVGADVIVARRVATAINVGYLALRRGVVSDVSAREITLDVLQSKTDDADPSEDIEGITRQLEDTKYEHTETFDRYGLGYEQACGEHQHGWKCGYLPYVVIDAEVLQGASVR